MNRATLKRQDGIAKGRQFKQRLIAAGVPVQHMYLYGSVASWVLLISVFMGGLAAGVAAHRYEEWEARSARGR